MQIDKSPETRAKENQIQQLEADLKKVRTTIKSLKTRLENNKTLLTDMQRQVSTVMGNLHAELTEHTGKIKRLAQKLIKDRRFKGEDKAFLKQICLEILDDVSGGERVIQEAEEREQAFFEEMGEQEQAQNHDPFAELYVAPEKEAQKDIRKTFLKLSKQFHPDRARSKAEEQEFHRLQQQINEAYKAGDAQTLLELEMLWQDAGPASDEEAHSTDALDSQIRQLELQLSMLEQQKKRLSQELKNIRESDLGYLISDSRHLKKRGMTFEELPEIQMLKSELEPIKIMADALALTDKEGVISDTLFKFFQAQPEDPYDLFNLLFEEEDEEDEDEDDELYITNPSPAFPVGTTVKLKSTFEIITNWETGAYQDFKGFKGTVTKALLDAETEEALYYIRLSTSSLSKIDPSYITETGPSFNVLIDIEEGFLAKTTPGRKVSEAEEQAIYETLLYLHGLKILPKAQHERLLSILLPPTGSVEERWLDYFEEYLPLPFKAVMDSPRPHSMEKTKVTVGVYLGFRSGIPLMGCEDAKGNRYTAALTALQPKQPALRRVVNDLRAWADFMEYELEP